MKQPAKDLLIGAHTSTAKGLHNALLEGESIGATTIQLFTRNQRRWINKPLSHQEVEQWQETLKATGIKNIMSHDSYLINLGSADPDILLKSRRAFREEIIRCTQLGITFLNFHPGSARQTTPRQCLDTIAESLLDNQDLMNAENAPKLIIETTAGQGNYLGADFEDIAYIIEKTGDRLPLGVCMDTCHSFAAGYDIRTTAAWKKTLASFDRTIGLDYLKAFHLNDSLKGLGSHVDRHQPLGEGAIGIECFQILMKHPLLREIPKYLETPGGPPLWQKEIKMLREFSEI
ncbi:MAG: deoxyribonuclease IV [Chlamydiota bacterium]